MDLLNLNNIDEKATKEKVDALLKSYHRYKRLSGTPTQTITQTYSLTPRSETGLVSSEIERLVQRKVDAERLVEDINAAINAQDIKSRKRLTDKYIKKTNLYDYQIYGPENISESTYYRELASAQMGFAEAFRDGSLLVDITSKVLGDSWMKYDWHMTAKNKDTVCVDK